MIDDRTVAHVARLSRLELSDEERERFRAQLGSILEHFQSLLALDLSGEAAAGGAKPARGEDARTSGAANVLRDDTVRPCLPLDEVLANAPASENGCFVVPPVIEEE
ncbi:MAG TPA: Asp-tRNA(Asn)/Glu-tRNA(Gln) amidotransferase subunit GatC [bacterium]|nr:Asp-tRNA(Asn)/Glu-tRNA(Gln) amidotransferase subunit GatC [bacterium]